MQTETQTGNRPKFGVIDLVWIAALAAVSVRFVQLATRFDFQPATIGVAIVLLLPLCGLPTRRFTLVEILVLLAFCGILFGLLSNWYIITYCGFLFALMIVRSARSIRDRIRWQTGGLLLVIVLGSVANYLVPPPRVTWLREARRIYPKIDMAPRLTSLRPALPVAQLSETDVLSDLASEYRDERFRIHQLRNVHDVKYEQFIERLGFGSARMLSLHAESLTIPDLEDIGFGAKDAYFPDETVVRTFYMSEKRVFDFKNMEPLSDEAFLQRTYADFLHPVTLGYSPQHKQAVGFSTHGFRFPLPKLEHEPYSLRLKRLELVSLLNFETPRVYILDHLPRMDQLRGNEIQTRELDAFEVSGLSELKIGKKIVVEDQLQHVQMLGAIPMIEQCQQCHEGAIGDLLGAFSYEFGQ